MTAARSVPCALAGSMGSEDAPCRACPSHSSVLRRSAGHSIASVQARDFAVDSSRVRVVSCRVAQRRKRTSSKTGVTAMLVRSDRCWLHKTSGFRGFRLSASTASRDFDRREVEKILVRNSDASTCGRSPRSTWTSHYILRHGKRRLCAPEENSFSEAVWSPCKNFTEQDVLT